MLLLVLLQEVLNSMLAFLQQLQPSFTVFVSVASDMSFDHALLERNFGVAGTAEQCPTILDELLVRELTKAIQNIDMNLS